MKIPSAGTDSFWALYRKLPKARKEQARKCYRLWAANALHGSLHFKPISDDNWSVRVGDHTRAVGKFQGKTFLWECRFGVRPRYSVEVTMSEVMTSGYDPCGFEAERRR